MFVCSSSCVIDRYFYLNVFVWLSSLWLILYLNVYVFVCSSVFVIDILFKCVCLLFIMFALDYFPLIQANRGICSVFRQWLTRVGHDCSFERVWWNTSWLLWCDCLEVTQWCSTYVSLPLFIISGVTTCKSLMILMWRLMSSYAGLT